MTAEDLDALKKGLKNTQTISPTTSKKIYIILTYAVAFDRVHYPLPLLRVDMKNNDEYDNNNIALDSQEYIKSLLVEIKTLKKERDMHLDNISKVNLRLIV